MDDANVMFRTERLLVRRLSADDYEAMMAVYGDADAMEYVDDGEPIGADEARQWIEITQTNYERRGYGMSAVALATSGDVIGFCGLVHPGGQDVAELKYAYGRQHWGLGYATEVGVAMLAYGQQTFGLARIIATTDPRNGASHRVLAKCGMRDDGAREDEDGDMVQYFEWPA